MWSMKFVIQIILENGTTAERIDDISDCDFATLKLDTRKFKKNISLNIFLKEHNLTLNIFHILF